MKKISLLFVGIAIMAATSSGIFAQQQGMQLPPVVVETAKAQQTVWQTRVQSVGSLSAFEGIAVRPEISGRITKIYFKSGQKINAGDPLVQINPELYYAQLMQAEAKLKLAEISFQRMQKLYRQRAVAKIDFDKAAAELQSAQGEVGVIKATLNQALVKAPFSGRLGLREVSLGDYTSPDQEITNLQQLDPLRVDFAIPEVYLGKLAIGQTVLVQTDAYPDKVFTGRVFAFDAQVNRQTRSLGVRASIPNKDEKLLPGIFVQVTLLAGEQKKVVTVPQTALVYQPDGYYIFKAVNDKAIKTKVIIGERDQNNIVITQGIQAGDVIIIAGKLKLQSGAPIIVRQ